MSIENPNVIDFVSIDLNGNVVLTISDHLEWDAENSHLLALQNKINAYLHSIESEDLYEQYPNAKDRNVIINIGSKYEPNEMGKIFLDRTEIFLKEAGYGFTFKIIPE